MAIKTLPAKEHTFTVDIKGLGTGQVYSGTFTYTRKTIRMKSEIAKTKAVLDGGLVLDEDMSFYHEVLAELRHTLKDSPQWWVDLDYGFELDELDTNVVFEIYKECNDFEANWRQTAQKAAPKTTEKAK